MRSARLLALLFALLIPAGAAAQYTTAQLSEVKATTLAVGHELAAAYPQAWRNAHDGREPSGTEFVRRWAIALRSRGIAVCVNGKRGGHDLSQDVLVFPVTQGGAQDTSGRYQHIAIIDLIVGAGGPNPSISWGDVSEFAPGRCIDPWLEPHEGGTPAPTPPPPQPPVVTPPAPTVDLGPVLAALARLEARLLALESRPAPSLDLFAAYVDDMVGSGPADDPALAPNHVTDILQRIDAVRGELAQLTAWLRSRRALGW